ncbi:MAG: SIR2 family protein [Pseudomonadota bacterium]
MTDNSAARNFKFLRNGDAEPEILAWNDDIVGARQSISESLNARNVAFLLGAGCSSLMREREELGISTMAPLAREFCSETLAARASGFYGSVPPRDGVYTNEEKVAELAEDHLVRGPNGDLVPLSVNEGDGGDAPIEGQLWRLTKAELDYLDRHGIDLEGDYIRNLERLMEVLYAHRFVLERNTNSTCWDDRAVVAGMIEKVQTFLWTKVTAGLFSQGDTAVRDLYEQFYKKLVLRDRSLPRPWVFTTNYDVFNETAMDRLGIPYANGFTGVIERRFNPASFRYALAEQLDVANRKWSAVDAFVYLCKLHGSVTWTEDDHGLFPIREVWPPPEADRMLIYPTPAKQNASLASPYADMFREFQSHVVREQSVLVTAGYAFGDEHLNNIIYQALTIPTFRLIMFADPDAGGEIAKLRALRDPRIWIVGGDGPTPDSRAHYFDTVVEHFMPQRPSDRIDDAVRRVLHQMAPTKKDDEK